MMPTYGFEPMLGSALQFAFEKATLEGKVTICALLFVSMFSWTVIFAKIRQLMRASRMTKRFFDTYGKTHDALELMRGGETFDGAPAHAVYKVGVEALEYHLKESGTLIRGKRRITATHFDTVRVAIERAVSDQVIVLERGMIVLSTAVSGGPFLGLLGTVWGVMETFAGIARASAASLTAMAPGVAGALIATVVGLFVAIPAMFAYNFMVTNIRTLSQQLDAFAAELVSAMELGYVDSTPWLTHPQQPAPAAELALGAVPANDDAVLTVGVSRP